MSVRPGKNLILGVFLVAILSLLVFFWWPIALVLLASLLGLAIAAAFEWQQLARGFDKIAVRRQLPGIVGRGRAFTVGLTVTNDNEEPLRCQLRDERPEEASPRLEVFAVTLPARSGRTQGTVGVSSTCRIASRGRYQFGPAWVRLVGRLRLLEAQWALDCIDTVKVLPETFASRDELQKDIGAELRLLDQQRRAQQHGTGTEFESLYAFRRGDDPRRIDWRATARRGTLVVRRFQVERHRDVMVVIDAGRLMGTQVGRATGRPANGNSGTKLDCAVDAALHLCRVALESGDRCGVAAYDRVVRGFLPPLAGKRALRSIVDSVYDLETNWHESDFTPMLTELRGRQSKRTFLIVISDLSDAETSKRLCASLQQLQRQHLVLFAALKTPLLGTIVREEIESLDDVARKAVAFRLLRDRSRALHSLRRGGVHVLDVEPQELTLPLINQFVQLRQRNLL